MTDNQLSAMKGCLHRLAGLLTGISAGLYCAKASEELDAALSFIDDTQALLDQAQEQLIKLKSVIGSCTVNCEEE